MVAVVIVIVFFIFFLLMTGVRLRPSEHVPVTLVVSGTEGGERDREKIHKAQSFTSFLLLLGIEGVK